MPDTICSITGCPRRCTRPKYGWCEAHYTRWRRHGDPVAGGPDRILDDDEARFWSKVDKTPTCWLFTGALAGGYGRFYLAGGLVPAHRYAYELLVGPIPEGLQLDHLCRVRNCVNPGHLEPVTQRENLLRGTGPSARHARAAQCPQGHPYDAANTYTAPNGHRHCRTCRAAVNRRRRATR